MAKLGDILRGALANHSRNFGVCVVAITLIAIAGCQTPSSPALGLGHGTPVALDIDLRCDAALAVLQYRAAHERANLDVLSEDPIDPGSWLNIRDRPQPSSGLLHSFASAKHSSALRSCRDLPKKARALGFQMGSSAQTWASREDDGRLLAVYRANVVWMTLPVVSYDGAEALVSYGERSGRLGGSGGVDYLKRDPDGRWRLVDDNSWMLS